jgi:hypothetical protein
MNEIIIGFSRPASFFVPFSWLIRLVTWSSMSHAYIRYYDTYVQRWIIFQASGLKVNFIGQAMFNANEIVCNEFSLLVSDTTKQCVIQKATDECGSSYGVKQIFGFAWIMFMRLFGKSVKNPFYSGSTFFCSELTGDILVEIGDANIDTSAMSPKDLFNYMISKGYKPL